MIRKATLSIVAVFILFFGYVSTRSGSFNYERNGVINAPADAIYPYLSQFKLGTEWSPYEKMDPNMKHTYGGTDGEIGAFEEFESDKAGSGRLEIMNMEKNDFVSIKLTMTKPIYGENMIAYRLTPVEGGTRFSWSMSGNGGFLTKLMSVFIDCEKMIAGDFEKGIENLKTLVESKSKGTNPLPGTDAK